jgi:predicted phosphodiesterase
MSQAPLKEIKACVFDAYGTLFDYASAALRCRDSLGEKFERVATLWREKQLHSTEQDSTRLAERAAPSSSAINEAVASVHDGAGRGCPSSYSYSPTTLARTAELRVDCLWIAGGLYGNPFALEVLLERYERERGGKALVFNGDFHWFDVYRADFDAVNDAVLSFHATRGNVETELSNPAVGAGCGCAYPDWVDEDTVDRSNRIIDRLRRTANDVPDALLRLSALPMHLRIDVGDARIAIVHGDASSLAGWGFSQERLAEPAGIAAALRAFDAAEVQVFASSHTCLPVLQSFSNGRILVNNGSAGMPNFQGELFGLATRIALSPADNSFYGVQIGELYIDAMALRYDLSAWEQRFLAQWPAGTDGHDSYYRRIVHGPAYAPGEALRTSK